METKLSPAVKKETRFIAVSTAAGTVLMIVVFAVLHAAMPEKVPFDHRVILAGAGGAAIAILNFYLMARTVQKVSAMENRDNAAKTLRLSYSYRMFMMMIWGAAAVLAPCFQFAAGLIPLLFPGAAIKLRGLTGRS